MVCSQHHNNHPIPRLAFVDRLYCIVPMLATLGGDRGILEFGVGCDGESERWYSLIVSQEIFFIKAITVFQ